MRVLCIGFPQTLPRRIQSPPASTSRPPVKRTPDVVLGEIQMLHPHYQERVQFP